MGFMKLFWGFIFLFDIRISGLDILPDFIGYILFYQGLKILEERNECFKKAKSYTFPMIFISILDIYQATAPMNGSQNTSISMLSIIFGIIFIIINLLIVYNICYGIAYEASLINDSELETKANNRLKLYLIINLIITIGIIFPTLLGILFIIIFIVSIISYVLMLGLMSLAANILE